MTRSVSPTTATGGQAEATTVGTTEVVTFEGQLSGELLAQHLANSRRSALEARTAYLKAHPEYIPCVVAGCLGLVAPNFQRKTADGVRWGVCPRQAAHATLQPAVFDQPSKTA